MKNSSKPSALVEALLKPETYPHKPHQVDFTQTQMSFVFLTGDYVFKVKKPVNLGYLDYTTLEKRRFFCEQEVVLNRRLSPDIYLDVIPIVKNGGRITIGGEGEVIDYAVKMKQLPRERTMDNLLLKGEVTTAMVADVAKKLVAFHAAAETNPRISAFGKLDAVMVNIRENLTQTENYVGKTIPRDQYERINAYNTTFTRANESLFQKRVDQGRVRDCHGDLHAAHVCLSNGIYIYDCIEFNDRFRYCDVASEVAFLAMDLDRYQRADLSRSFIDTYVQLSDDGELLHLLNFYKCYRAYVRGKVESFKLDDPFIAEKETALSAARSYFALAHRYTREKPLLVIISGMVGTGKTTVSQALSRSLGFTTISSDVTRKRLAGIMPTEHRFEEFQGGIYSPDFSRKTYDEMFAQARALLAKGQSVILDASFKKREERARAKSLADEANADFIVIECRLDEQAIKQRLEQRLNETSTSDGRWEIYESQKKEFDKIMEFSPQNHIIVNTLQPVDDIVNVILERV